MFVAGTAHEKLPPTGSLDPGLWRGAADQLRRGWILLDAQARIAACNAAAERLLAERDGLGFSPERDRLACARRSDADTLFAAVQAACAGRRRALLLPRSSGRRPLMIRLEPVAPDRCALWCATRDAPPPRASREDLAVFFDLTPAEAEMAEALAAGETVLAYAGRVGIRAGTARWRLKALQAKTDTHSLAELVLVLLSAPAG